MTLRSVERGLQIRVGEGSRAYHNGWQLVGASKVVEVRWKLPVVATRYSVREGWGPLHNRGTVLN